MVQFLANFIPLLCYTIGMLNCLSCNARTYAANTPLYQIVDDAAGADIFQQKIDAVCQWSQ